MSELSSKRRRPLVAVAALAMGVLLLSLVGASVSSGSVSVKPEVVHYGAPAGLTKTGEASTVQVGVIFTEGTAATSDPTIPADIVAAIRGINRTGGLGGHPVGLVACNDQANINLAVQCARTLISKKVVAMVGDTSQIGDANVHPLLEDAGIPEVAVNRGGPTTLNATNDFEFAVPLSVLYPVMGAFPMSVLKLKTAVVTVDVPAALGLLTLANQIYKPFGIGFAATVKASATTPDYSPSIAAVQSSGAKAAAMFLGLPGISQLMIAGARANAKLTYMAPVDYGPSEASSLGGAANMNNLVSIQVTPPLSRKSTNPVIKRFYRDLDAEAKTGDKATQGKYAVGSELALGFPAWLSVYALQQVVNQQHVKNFTAQTIMAAMNKAKNVNLGGVIPNWTPSKPSPASLKAATGLTRLSNEYLYVVGYRHGSPYLMTKGPVTATAILSGKVKLLKPPTK